IGLFSSCDKCKDVDCLNSGTCDKGECECTTFYSGDKCEAEIRADYNATYAGTFGFGDGTSFADTIQLRSFGTDVSKLEIIDGEGIILTLTSATNFNLFAEEIDDSAKYTVSGTGNFSSTAMSLTGTSTEAKNGQIIDVETISFNGIKI
ncbi:MAG: hypothetical protein ACPGEG_03580, partial [Salibacteraceae bacterium]